MGKTQPVRRSTVFVFCLFTILLLAPVSLAQAPPPQAPPPQAQPPDECKGEGAKVVTVTISGEDHAISVDPDSVTIDIKGRVCWEISGLEAGHKLTMSGKAETDDHFPERFVAAPQSVMNSGVPAKKGTFHYQLVLSKDGSEISKLDPEIIIGP